ncbi:MAG: hypothetical protein KDJ68_15885 [Rhodobiaceae bacterium]|nr:hypothetical protein [Rhodobiaceae bacterium]
MGFRDAVNAVPAKPIIATAVVATLLAAAWHGYTLHDVCSKRASLTSSLHAWADGVLASPGTPTPFDPPVDFDWDAVRIAGRTSQTGNVPNCRFGWHWSDKQRQDMAAAGHLALIGFFRDGRLVELADFDNRHGVFNVSDTAIARDKAVFSAKPDTQLLQQVAP